MNLELYRLFSTNCNSFKNIFLNIFFLLNLIGINKKIDSKKERKEISYKLFF